MFDESENSVYVGFEKIVYLVVIFGGALFCIYWFAVNVLPWIILLVVVGAIIFFYFWQRSTRRSEHPWE